MSRNQQAKELVRCLSCGPQPLSAFRIFREVPPIKYYDFCGACVDKHGLTPLYEKHAMKVSPDILDYLRRGGPQIEQAARTEAEKQRDAAQRDLAERALAQRHIIPYVKRFMPSYDTGWVHHDICARLERFVAQVERLESPRLILALPPRAGKGCAHDTPVLTNNRGWTTHGELRVDDEVFSPSGRAIKVIALSQEYEADQIVRTTTDELQVHTPHEWTVYDRGRKAWRTMETQEFGQRMLTSGKIGRRGGRYMFQLSPVAPLQMPARELPLDPYCLGAWLGDGTAINGVITVGPDKEPVIEAFVAAGFEIGARNDLVGCQRVGILKLAASLRALGVLNNKHVPELYMRASIDQRAALLAGLVDTDGYVEKRTGRVQFSNTNTALIEAVEELCRMFGWRPTTTWEPPKLTTSGIQGRQWGGKVGFNPTFALPLRVKHKQGGRLTAQRRLAIEAITEAAEPKTGRCIQVDSPDGLYLVGRGLTPTHNSILGSDFLPSWVLGKFPKWEIIAASHSINLSAKFSRNIRDRMNDPRHTAVFPDSKIRADAQAVEEWRTTQGGGYRAAGVGTGILGMGGHVCIVDDPFPDAETAYSEKGRERVRDWFNTTLMSRLAPGGGALIIAQRWHDDDLTGYVLRLRKELAADGVPPEELDNWQLVNYPAIAEGDEYLMPSGQIVVDPADTERARLLRKKGEALHPARYDLPKLIRIKNRMPPPQWNALYQQNPVPDEGDFFSKDMFRYEEMLAGTRNQYVFLTAWDVAIGEKRRNDYSVGVVVAADADNNMHVVDMVRGRFGTMELVNNACDLIQKWDCAQFGMEHGAIKMTLWPLIKDEMRRRKIACSISEDLKPINEKEIRATPLRGLMQTGRVSFPREAHAPWVATMRHEMLRFPTGVHDDIVDALAWAARLFIKAPRPMKLLVEGGSAERPWRERLDEFGISGMGSSGSFMAN